MKVSIKVATSFLLFTIIFISTSFAGYANSTSDYSTKPLPTLFVHGYDSSGDDWAQSEIYAFVKSQGVSVGVVDYKSFNKNDITSANIQEIYKNAFDQLYSQAKSPKIDIVVHSMGGLLTRYFLDENPQYQDKVRRVYFLGTPNHGSPVAFLNRLENMLKEPEVYWGDDWENDEGILKYYELYKEYAEDMFTSFGKVKDKPTYLTYENWIKEKHPEVIKQFEDLQKTKVGGELTNVGTPVLQGGLPYRYSGAFNDYAKLLKGRALFREYKVYYPGHGYHWDPKIDSATKDRLLIIGGNLDTATKFKEKHLGSKTDQENTAKNIVQDRLMFEYFEMLTDVAPNGKIIPTKLVANPFLYDLGLHEFRFRNNTMNKKYIPQYITVATVDSPRNPKGRMMVDPFIKNVSVFPYEEHDAVVPLSSVKLLKSGFLDRNIRVLNKGSNNLVSFYLDGKVMEARIPDNAVGKYASNQEMVYGYVSHGDQMKQVDLFRHIYQNPLTGYQDANAVIQLIPNLEQSYTGNIAILKTDLAEKRKYHIQMTSDTRGTIRILKRDQYEVWNSIATIPLEQTQFADWIANYELDTNEAVHDYLILSDTPVGFSFRLGDWNIDIDDSPYFIDLLETIEHNNNLIKQRFRVVDRYTGKSIGKLSSKDFIVKLDDAPFSNYRLSMEKVTVKNSANILLALDYSGSMSGQPLIDSKNAAFEFISNLKGKTSAKVGVIGFSDDIHLLAPLGTNYDDIARSPLVDLTGWTPLYDAIVYGSELLSQQSGRKSLFLMTDGEDSSSQASLQTAISTAKQYGVSVYIFGLGDVQANILQQITRETGGKYVHTIYSKELIELYQGISEETEYIYTIEYTNPRREDLYYLSIQLTGDRSAPAEVAIVPTMPFAETLWDRTKTTIQEVGEAWRGLWGGENK